MEKVTARFICESVTTVNCGFDRNEATGQYDVPKLMENVKFRAIWTNHPADNNYSEATPNGELDLTITNAAVHHFFIPGKVYNLAITEHSAS